MSSPADLAEFADFARELARCARAETLPRWKACCEAVDKGDPGGFDPVTEADRQAELRIRETIKERFPDHGITGEEFPDEPAAGPWTWSLDPVDGTRSFICRLPTWVTLIALLHDGRPALGLIDAPCLDETYVGFGREAWMQQRSERSRLAVSGCRSVKDARLSATDPAMFSGETAEAFEAIRRSARTVRYGHDGYAYARLAGGSIDLVIECGLKPHDYNALVPVVSAAGGVIRDWRGGTEFAGGRVIAAASEELFEQALRYLERVA